MWLYYRFALSHRDIEVLPAERDIEVSYGAVRLWCRPFRPARAVLYTLTQCRWRRARGSAFVPTWVFVAAYLLVWTAFGVVAFAAASLA